MLKIVSYYGYCDVLNNFKPNRKPLMSHVTDKALTPMGISLLSTVVFEMIKFAEKKTN